MTGRQNPWRTLGGRQIYDSAWIGLREDAVISPGGQEASYGVVHYKNTAIGVLPLADDGHVHLVGQWRYALGAFSWEIPEGGGSKDRDPLDEARRELREETGLEAAHWRQILRMHLSNSITDEEAVIFLATGLRHAGAPQLEHSEHGMEQARIPFADLLRRVTAGDITDSLTVAAVLRTHQMAVQGELETGLAEILLKGAR